MIKTYSIQHILRSMHSMYKDYPITELEYVTPFQCLIAVMMSAQTTDKQVNKITRKLFNKIKSPFDVIDMGEDVLGDHIRTIGLRKSKRSNIIKTAKLLVKETNNLKLTFTPKNIEHFDWVYSSSYDVLSVHWYYLPDTIHNMIKLPWVWIKTAKVVLYVLFRQKRVAVDTHVHRVMNRLSVVDTKTAEQTSKLLEDIIPDSYKDIAHHSIIYFWRYLCKARKPECGRCPLKSRCNWYKNNRF